MEAVVGIAAWASVRCGALSVIHAPIAWRIAGQREELAGRHLPKHRPALLPLLAALGLPLCAGTVGSQDIGKETARSSVVGTKPGPEAGRGRSWKRRKHS